MRILMGYTRTELGEAVARHAIEEARRRSAELLVLNTQRGTDDQDEAARYRAGAAGARGGARERRCRHRVLDYTVGDSLAEDLLAAARKNEVDLLVIGLRRRSPVGKLVMGSTAQEILLNADCPVLAVKLPPSRSSTPPSAARSPVRCLTRWRAPPRPAPGPAPGRRPARRGARPGGWRRSWP
jgi:nucleotide-binding universal stress UspA family protein